MLAKTELLKGTGYYELDDKYPIPNCMVQGSLHGALEMVEYNTAICYLESRCMHDIKGYIRNRSNPPEINKKRFGNDGWGWSWSLEKMKYKSVQNVGKMRKCKKIEDTSKIKSELMCNFNYLV